ncbi:hypothetical protein PMAYCL1PPCAC_05930, partial [Pristionchus mayeri]
NRNVSCNNLGHHNTSGSLHPCRACRLDRLVKGGMNPLLILAIESPESNPVVRKYFRVREEDVKPSTSTDNVNCVKLEVAPVPKRSATPSVFECTIERVIGALLHLEKAHDNLRGSPFDPDPAKFRLDSVIVSPSLMSMSTEELETYASDVKPLRKPWRKFWPLAD